jgi:hypothetical protein
MNEATRNFGGMCYTGRIKNGAQFYDMIYVEIQAKNSSTNL